MPTLSESTYIFLLNYKHFDEKVKSKDKKMIFSLTFAKKNITLQGLKQGEKKMDQIQFGIIGCGRIARKHIPLLAEMPEARIVAVCDPIEERARAYATKYQVPFYTDYRYMLEKEPSIQVVNILTPSGSHSSISIEVARMGKDIIVEKPMALRLEDADQMIRTCDQNGVRLFVVKQNRYNLPIKKLRSAIENDRFGKLVLGTVRVRWSRDQAYYDMDKWRGTWAMDGGVLTNQASHHIDLLEWMMGNVESVVARTTTALLNIEVEDTGVALLKFSNGALGVVEATVCARPNDLEGSISILGEKGTVEIAGFAVNQMRTWSFVDQTDEDNRVIEECNQYPQDVYGFGHYEYLKDVIYCIKNNKKALVDGLEGRKSLELINAIYESVETGNEVPLRFKPKKCKLGLNS